jgi:sugar phosphate isomerase/epimerase
MLSTCIDIVEHYGLELAVETIPCQVADPLRNIYRAIEWDERTLVALDTEFLAWHGQVEAVFQRDWLWETQRVRHIHIKDYDGHPTTPDGHRRYLHPGQGQIDFPRFFSGLQQRNFTGYLSLEAPVDIRRLKESLQFIHQGIAQAHLQSKCSVS